EPGDVRPRHLGQHGPRGERHGAHAVGDDPGQSHRLGELLVQVIGIGSPDASLYRYVWSSSTRCRTLATGPGPRSASSNLCPGASSPRLSPGDPSTKSRTKNVTNCSLTSSPSWVRVATATQARVPLSNACQPVISACASSTSPGRIGR